MRTVFKKRGYFEGTHKGASITIGREADRRFYIFVTHADGCHLYDGWAPDSVTTMAAAKREARYGACLDKRPSGEAS